MQSSDYEFSIILSLYNIKENYKVIYHKQIFLKGSIIK